MKTKSIKDRIKQYFFLNPTVRLRVRKIERETGSPLPSVIRYTKELEKEGILKSQEISGSRFYSSDRESKRYILEKKMFNIMQIHESGLLEYLIERYSNPVIILFGSYSKGEDIEDSDIDIYVESPSRKKLDMKRFEKKTGRAIQLFIHKNIREIKNKELANNIINGSVLNGFIEVL